MRLANGGHRGYAVAGSGSAPTRLGSVHHIAGWWDGFELWVAGLPFIPQFAVVLIGAVPVSFLLAYLLDRGLRLALRALGRDRRADSAPQVPVAPEVSEDTVPRPEPVLSGASMHGSGSMHEKAV